MEIERERKRKRWRYRWISLYISQYLCLSLHRDRDRRNCASARSPPLFLLVLRFSSPFWQIALWIELKLKRRNEPWLRNETILFLSFYSLELPWCSSSSSTSWVGICAQRMHFAVFFLTWLFGRIDDVAVVVWIIDKRQAQHSDRFETLVSLLFSL